MTYGSIHSGSVSITWWAILHIWLSVLEVRL